jgi:hypothetical protein
MTTHVVFFFWGVWKQIIKNPLHKKEKEHMPSQNVCYSSSLVKQNLSSNVFEVLLNIIDMSSLD